MSVSRAAAVQSPVARNEPRSIRIETEHYLVRTLEPCDATERACAWFADPGKARMINAPARAYSLHELKEFIASHDRVTGHALGIFDKGTELLIGFWAVYVDWGRSEFLLNVLVGERGYEHGARGETQRKITETFFDEFDLRTLRCAVLAKNERMENRMELARMSPEHTTHKPSASGEAFEEVHHYRLDRDTWRKYRDTRMQRDLVRALTDAAWAGI